MSFLPPADARAAFGRGGRRLGDLGAVPRLEAATSARQLADGTGIVNNHEFYLASRDLVERDPEAVATILESLAGCVDAWVNANKAQVAAEFSPSLGIPVPILAVAVDRRTYGVSPITPGWSTSSRRSPTSSTSSA